MDYMTLYHMSFWIGFLVASLIGVAAAIGALILLLRRVGRELKKLVEELKEDEQEE